MVLVDTSVWIRFLGNRLPDAAELDRLLDTEDVAAHDLVQGELLIGDPGGRADLLHAYALMHRVPTVLHGEVAGFVRAHKLHGRGFGWIDAHLLASAMLSNVRLWTADARLGLAAHDLGVEYVPRRR